jgi:hypothetical protein
MFVIVTVQSKLGKLKYVNTLRCANMTVMIQGPSDYVQFEFIATVKMSMYVFWFVTACGIVGT